MSRTSRCVRFAFCVVVVQAAVMCAGVRALAVLPDVTEPPVARVIPVADTTHGDVRVDDYAWLRDRTDPEVIAYLEAENAHTDTMMKHTEPLQEMLYEEMIGRIKETDLTVPYRKDGYFYYRRTEEGKQYRIFCRKTGSLDADEEILLDVNELAVGHDFFEIGRIRMSPDHQTMAYAVDTTGAEHYTLYIKDVATGELLPDVIEDMDYTVEWGNDNQTIFYTTTDDAERPDKLWRHSLGSDVSDDVLIHHEADPVYWVDCGRTRSDDFLLMTIGRRTESEEWILSADDPLGEFHLVEPRVPQVEYYLSHHGDDFYIRTNAGGKNFEVMKAPVETPSREYWESVVAHRDDVKVERIRVFRNHLVVYERDMGLRKLRIMDLEDGGEHYIEFPEPTYAVYGGDNREYDTELLRFEYASFVTPESVYDYNMNTRERELLKQDEILGGYDPSLYVSDRLYAIAGDGTQVPVSVVYRRDAFEWGENPLLVMGYGSYGASMDPWFSPSRLSFLDRGVVYAIANVRGGGEMGEEWYEGGRILTKKNTFTDFISCVEHLIEEGYGDPERVGIWGGSAGGLLIGAVVNMRPDLFTAAVANVPFVDVINTMLDPSIPLTTNEYEEWGNPNIPEHYEYMKSYSPYDNVGAYDYPDLLISGNLHDARVQYWEPAKWTAKLRANKVGDGLVLLQMTMGGGHGGASGRYDQFRDTAFKYAFVLDRLGAVE